MKKYIGTKTVEAQPMTRWEAFEENLLKAGVVAEQKDKEVQGYEIRHDDGYRSWSPKETFDEAYRLADTPIDRMRIEIAELSDKIGKLGKFIASERFQDLDEEMQDLLRKQHYHMDKYYVALSSRIILMTGQEENTGNNGK